MATTEEKYLNGGGVSDLINGLQGLFANTTKTEAQAIAAASTTPNTVYLTSDTHNIVMGGAVYGRSAYSSSAFAFASDTSAISTWDTSKIYLVPTATSGVLQVYAYNGGWTATGTISLTPATNAGDITYDLTNTPGLGTGNVQSAIEAVNATIDGSPAMASIAGLGYNLWDYITGNANLTGFEYGSTYRLENPKKTGNGNEMFKANTSFVYFPRLNMTGITTQTYSMFHNCTNLVVVPSLTFNLTGSAQNMFNGCSKLVVVGKLTGLNVSAGLYMFAGCTALKRIEEVDISAMVMTTHKNTTNMFRSNSGTGTAVLSNLRYILLKGIGTLSSVTAYWFANPRNWGVNTTDIPDAKQSLWDSLYTYSYDRAAAGYANCTIHLYSSSYNALTTEEREQITAKGYVLTTS